MKERPIIFSAPMVRALLDGTKTQTRRVAKADFVEELDFLGGAATDCDAPGIDIRWGEMQHDDSGDSGKPQWLACCRDYPEEGFIELGAGYGAIGDQLWVRENFCYADQLGKQLQDQRTIIYTATHDGDRPRAAKPSIHMPRWASRITLEITGVRVERLHDISETDAKSEGSPLELGTLESTILGARAKYRSGYCRLWESINGTGSWDLNPWVWVVEFKRIEGGAA